MRLTADLVRQGRAWCNPCDQRELSLRGLQIAAIENLGATLDQFSAIDLSDNEILKLDNMAPLPHLETLMLHQNRVRRISPGLGALLPRLTSLQLASNDLARLQDLDPLADIPKLRSLTLLRNPVASLDGYRAYVVHLLPELELLDFTRVNERDREQSRKLFGDAPALRSESDRRREQNTDHDPIEQAITAEQKSRILVRSIFYLYLVSSAHTTQAAIESASSLEQIAALERMLSSGKIRPSDFEKIALIK